MPIKYAAPRFPELIAGWSPPTGASGFGGFGLGTIEGTAGVGNGAALDVTLVWLEVMGDVDGGRAVLEALSCWLLLVAEDVVGAGAEVLSLVLVLDVDEVGDCVDMFALVFVLLFVMKVERALVELLDKSAVELVVTRVVDVAVCLGESSAVIVIIAVVTIWTTSTMVTVA